MDPRKIRRRVSFNDNCEVFTFEKTDAVAKHPRARICRRATFPERSSKKPVPCSDFDPNSQLINDIIGSWFNKKH